MAEAPHSNFQAQNFFMNIKRYRAATMREALEQVKDELGEEALVLETKSVRAGGFLGVGAREMVEVRVAADSVAPAKPRQENQSEKPAEKPAEKPRLRREASSAKLNLTEDTPATPRPSSEPIDLSSLPTLAALAARAYASHPIPRANGTPKADLPNTARATEPEEAPLHGIEIADTAPRLAHRAMGAAAAKLALAHEGASAPPMSMSRELERLRAELREVKFALGGITVRTVERESDPRETQAAFDAEPQLYDSPYYDAYLELTIMGIQPELALQAIRAVISSGMREVHDIGKVARTGLVSALPSSVCFGEDPLAILPAASNAPMAIAFIGPTGVGKTTTIAKLAARVGLRARRRVELITLDTYRIAAVEQLKTYAEIIGAGCHVARSVVELDALTQRFAGEATVLIDTIGRSPHDLADQLEFADYLRGNEQMHKCLVIQATTNATDAQIAIKKFAIYGADRLVITKLDEAARPGTTVFLAAQAALPLIYLCAGQRVPEDLERATPLTFAARVARARFATAA
jgi:flagellar biosynthesis protein FlhF